MGIGIDGQQLDTCTAMGGIQGTFPTSPTSAFPVCRYSYVDFSNLVEEEDRYQIYGQIDVDLGPNTTFHAEAIYAGMEMIDYAGSPSYPPVQGPLGPGSANAFSVPASNPGYAAYLAQTFPAGSPAYLSSLSNILFFRPFALGGNPLDERGAGLGSAENEAWRISAGSSMTSRTISAPSSTPPSFTPTARMRSATSSATACSEPSTALAAPAAQAARPARTGASTSTRSSIPRRAIRPWG